jgi:SET domain-containing protein
VRRGTKRAKRKLPFEVRRSPIHGLGVIATHRIRAGTRVIEYAGERITFEEAAERYDDDDAKDQHHTFLFEVGDDTLIDAGHHGNEARFINHSCDPNCATFAEDGRVFIETIRNIQPGTELTYDYAYKRDGRRSAAWARLYACHCGAANCRGTMLKPERKRRSPSREGAAAARQRKGGRRRSA